MSSDAVPKQPLPDAAQSASGVLPSRPRTSADHPPSGHMLTRTALRTTIGYPLPKAQAASHRQDAGAGVRGIRDPAHGLAGEQLRALCTVEHNGSRSQLSCRPEGVTEIWHRAGSRFARSRHDEYGRS